MRSTNVTNQPNDDEDLPPPPFQWWSGGAVFHLGMFGYIGILVGALLGFLLGTTTGVPLLTLVGVGLGVAAGLALGYRELRKHIGRGQRTSAESLPPSLPLAESSTHVMALLDNLATAPAKRVTRIDAHAGRVRSMAVSPDGKWLLTGSSDHTVKLFDLATGIEVRQFAAFGGIVWAVAFSPDGRLAAACGHDRSELSADGSGIVLVWDAGSGRELRRFDARGLLLTLAFTPDGRRLLLGGSDYLRVWDLETAELLALFNLKSSVMSGETVLSLAVSPDGRFALCGSRTHEGARLIDLGQGDCVRRFRGGRRAWLFVLVPVAFSPDGRRVLTGSHDQTARVWDVDTGKQLTCFTGHRGRWGWRGVTAVAFLGDGRRALSGSEDGTVRLWDANTGSELMRFDHGARVCSLATSRSGRLALSGGKDGVVRAWELPASVEGPSASGGESRITVL
jgi:WD40 repeat protein